MFEKINFNTLFTPDFKEDSVREVLILPIIQRLGYAQDQIIRSKTLAHPFIKVGSQKRAVNLVPDYLFKIEDAYAWVLDAKAPNENITQGEHIEQVFSYATHPEIRTKFFALCNGREFALFRTDEQTPFLYFLLQEIDRHWEEVERYLSPASFQTGKTFTYQNEDSLPNRGRLRDRFFDYLNRPLLEEIPVRKQAAKRHFGVHGYFTKQTWNVVQAYILNFSQAGDTVLDPFGGSGITSVEALMTDRKAIHIDLNPMSVFMVDALVAPVKISELTKAFNKIKKEYEASPIAKFDTLSKAEQTKYLKMYPYPTNLSLPKGSDVQSIEELFSDKQLTQLAYLKHLIKQVKNANIQKSLLLAFSSSVNKFNLTFHYTESEGGGDSAVFRYYRYRIAPKHDALELWAIFETKFKKVINAKQEIEPKINERNIQNAQIVKGTATNLSFIKKESVDYIYTDPPYGKKIPYLDLSTMWNGWLDLKVTAEDFKLEAIEGGEQDKSKDEYNLLIKKSIEEMYRVLKFDRWMSFVFAHKDPEFWHLIIETAERCGFEYAGAVSQKNGQTSFKKRQNAFTVLSGQLIINFRKVRKPKFIMKASLGMEIGEIVLQTVEGIIAKNNGANLEQINDELIIKGLELGFLDLLKKEYADLTPFLLDTFDYDEKTELFSIKKDKKFKTHIDLNLRVRYYLISYLRRMEREKKTATFDEIILHIIPLLKNGITPEKQTVLNVLETIAERVGKDAWRLKQTGQGSLFE
jgi:DNA modification methylase